MPNLIQRLRQAQRAKRGFTLIELIVAIGVSVILISILTFVFRVSTNATRKANSRVSITERMRSLNIRMRQEIGAMLPVSRKVPNPAHPMYDIPTPGTLIFSAATNQDGLPVSTDVQYRYVPGGTPVDGRLYRLRSKLGTNGVPKLGQDDFVDPPEEQDVLMINVRDVKFEDVDPPPAAATSTELQPRVLPAAVKLTITFGPELGDKTELEKTTITFPVYRGL